MRPKVIVQWWPERDAVLVQRGERVSEIMWTDDHSTRYVPNRQWIMAEANKPAIVPCGDMVHGDATAKPGQE